MGLDGVELVMEIEDEFNIKLDDAETGQTQTVGQLIALVEHKVTPQARQSLGPAFYRLRQVLADSALIDKRLIRPNTDLRPFIPPEHASSVWRELREAGFRIPSLNLSKRGVVATVSLWLVFIILATKAINYLIPGSGWGLGAGATGFVIGWIPAVCVVLWLASTPLFPSLAAIPASHATAGAIARRWSGIVAECTPASAGQEAPVTPSGEDEDSGARGETESDRPEVRVEEALAHLKEILRGAGIQPSVEFDTSVSLSDLLARCDRWRVWRSLEEAGAPILPLRLTWFARAIIGVPIAAVAIYSAVVIIWMFVLLVGAGQIGTALISVGAGLIAVLLFSSGVERALSALGRAHRLWWLVSDIPKEWKTLGETAQWMAEHGWPYSPPPFTIHSRSIALRVRQLVAQQAGISVEKVLPESRFVQDLGF